MTGPEMRDARAALGKRWGLRRPLHMSELGRALRLSGADPGQSIRDYERGTTRISGPVSVALEMMLAGALPPDGIEAVKATPMNSQHLAAISASNVANRSVTPLPLQDVPMDGAVPIADVQVGPIKPDYGQRLKGTKK